MNTLQTSDDPLHLGSHLIHLLTRPRFGAESSGSQPGYRKLFPHGPHSSKNNFFGLKISQRRDWECPSLSYYGSWFSNGPYLRDLPFLWPREIWVQDRKRLPSLVNVTWLLIRTWQTF